MESALSSLPVATRVLILRLIAGTASVLLTFLASVLLARELELSALWRDTLVFAVFCSQMFYASVAHVSNDWLAVPVLGLLDRRGGEAYPAARQPLRPASGRDSTDRAKAYYLVLLPLLGCVLVWQVLRRRTAVPELLCIAMLLPAVPWYARNLIPYGNLPGTVEATGGITVRKVIEAAPAFPWTSSIAYMARASVWTVNNSFINFSVPLINAYLAIVFALVILSLLKPRPPIVCSIARAAVLVFIAGIAFDTVASYLLPNGRSARLGKRWPGGSFWAWPCAESACL